MSNDPSSGGRDALDSESFEEWLEQAADSKGVSKQELMNQMLSSYWILDELTGLVDETGAGVDAKQRTPAAAEPNPEVREQTDPTAETDGPNDEPESTTASTEESIREIQTAIQTLVEAQSASEAKDREQTKTTSESPPTLDGGVVSVVSELQRQVGSFDSKLEDLEERQETQFERLSSELQLALDRVNELEYSQDRFVESEELEAVTGEIRREIRTFDDELDALQTADADLENRVEREFDSIEALFRRVLDALDDLEADLDSTAETYRSELEPIQERETEREQLESLKEEALRREIRTGACESCGRKIDLALLESPGCPNCSVRFVGLGERGWNPFQSPPIETASRSIDD